MGFIWPYLTLLATAGGAAIYFYWRRRSARDRDQIIRQERNIAASEEEHRRDRAHLRDQQQALFNSMLEGVLILNKDGRIQSVNRSLEGLFGLTVDIRGQTLMEAFRLHELSDMVNLLVAEGSVRAFELNLPTLQRRCLEINGALVFDQKGERQGMILVFHDLTRLKELENTRQEFVANVSHELRTPLSLIKGFVETLLDGAADDPLVAKRFLHTIERHTDRLTYLIEDLLTISRLESGQIAMNLQPAELGRVVKAVLDDLRARAAEKEMMITDQTPEGITAQADVDRLQQVLFNLVENAIKYGRRGGQVAIGARYSPEQKVEIWVSDDGPGIPPEAKERIFERFYRVDKARSREAGGTGLGLSIVKHIVQAHGGEVSVDSTVGQGATFSFTLKA